MKVYQDFTVIAWHMLPVSGSGIISADYIKLHSPQCLIEKWNLVIAKKICVCGPNARSRWLFFHVAEAGTKLFCVLECYALNAHHEFILFFSHQYCANFCHLL